jgi:hypothetical protein
MAKGKLFCFNNMYACTIYSTIVTKIWSETTAGKRQLEFMKTVRNKLQNILFTVQTLLITVYIVQRI